MNNPNLSISIDSREFSKSPNIAEGLKNQGINIVVKSLPSGDYAVEVEDGYIIERKTAIDLASSIKSGRLWRELEKIKNVEGASPILLVEGSLSLIEKFTKWSPSSIIGTINSIIFEWDVKTVFLPSSKWTVIYLSNLVKSVEIEEKKPRPLQYKKKAVLPSDYVLMVVESLPGVSAVKARNIMAYFKTLRRLFDADEHSLMKIEGIGEKTARKIVEIMDYELDLENGRNGNKMEIN